MKKWVGVGIICSILSLIIFYMAPREIKETQFVTAFEEAGCQMLQTNIHTWGKLSDGLWEYDEMEAEVLRISKELGIESIGIIEKKENENIREYLIIRSSPSAKTTIQIESIQNEEKIETYAIIDIILYEGFEGALHFKEISKGVFEKWEVTPTSHVTMTGTYAGMMDLKEKKEVAHSIMQALGAKVHDTFETNQIYNQYGYTPMVEEWIQVGNHKVNVDLALRYNEYENNTYLYLATPMITVEY